MMRDSTEIRACRTCMGTKDNKLQNLFTNDWEEKFQLCFNFKVREMEYGPNLLCNECAEVITNFVEFKQKCMKSEAFWKMSYKQFLNIPSGNVKNNDISTNMVEYSSKNKSSIFIKVLKVEPEIECKLELNDNLDNTNRLELDSSCNDENNTDTILKFKKQKTSANKRKTKSNKFAGQCNWCKKHYSNKYSMIAHLKHCTRPKDPLKVKAKKLFTKLTKDKKNTSKYHCGLCEMSTDCKSTIYTHLEGHEKSTNLSCSLCDFKGLDLADYMAHRFEHQPADLKTFFCHKCSYKCRIPIKFEFHYRWIHLQGVPGRCRFCDKTYTNYKMWKYHLSSHSLQLSLECDVCGRLFLMKQYLTQHMTTHSDIKKHMCDLCGFSTRKSYDLKSHIQAVHEIKKPHPCQICGKLYKNVHGLRLHMRMRHLENKFTCVVCGKCYPSEKILKNHEIWHSDLRPFKCHLCEKAFKSRSHLDEHIHTHSTNKAFGCEVCLKTFTTKKLLKTHQKRNSHFTSDNKAVD